MGIRSVGENLPHDMASDYDCLFTISIKAVKRIGDNFIWQFNSFFNIYPADEDFSPIKVELTGEEFYIQDYKNDMLIEQAKKILEQVSSEIVK